jgi:antitoxin FitA
MPQLIVRNLESAVKNRLQQRAKRNGRSMEEEVRDILRNAASETGTDTEGLGTAIAKRFSKIGFESEIQELRGYEVKPATFKP